MSNFERPQKSAKDLPPKNQEQLRVTEYFKKIKELLTPKTPEPKISPSEFLNMVQRTGAEAYLSPKTYKINNVDYPIVETSNDFETAAETWALFLDNGDEIPIGFKFNPNHRIIQNVGFENVLGHEEIHFGTSFNRNKFAAANRENKLIFSFVDEFIAYTRSMTLEIRDSKPSKGNRCDINGVINMKEIMIDGTIGILKNKLEKLKEENKSLKLRISEKSRYYDIIKNSIENLELQEKLYIQLIEIYTNVIDRCMQDGFESVKVRQLLINLRKKADSLEKLKQIGENFLLS